MSKLQYASLKTTSGKQMALEGMEVSGDVRGLILDMQVTQRFFNTYDCHAEIVYTFPLPWGAILLNVEVTLGDQKLTGVVVEKKLAEAKYEETLSDGDTAIMLEKNTDHSYSLSLGNIASKEHCVIHFQYAQTLQFEQRGLRLLIPTVIAPRYDGGADQHAAQNIPAYLRPQHDVLAEYPFEIQLRLHGAIAHARITSPSHSIAMMTKREVVTLSLAHPGALDRDFVLILDQLQQDAVAVAITGQDKLNPEHHVVMASFCPRIAQEELPSIDVNLLVDCSGSMAGVSIASARRALQAIVAQLGDGDCYSLSKFGSTVEHRSRAMWKVTANSKLAAQRWINDLDATLGGTEMEAALLSTFRQSNQSCSDVLMITDGEIDSIDKVIDTAKASEHRIFIVGIGSSPAESHLRRLAQATGGVCDFVAPGEAVEPAILRMFARLRSPRLESVSLVWPEECTPIWTSSFNANIFDSDTVNVFAVLPRPPGGVLRLLGRRVGNPEHVELGTVLLGSDYSVGDTLSRVAANNQFNSLSTTLEKDLALHLAVSYQLVTASTNFLLLYERGESEKAIDMPELYQVKNMIPAGFAGMGDIPLFSRRASPASNINDANVLSKPCVWRHSSVSDHLRDMSVVSESTASYIPKFLRMDDGFIESPVVSPPQISSNREIITALLDHSNHYFWAEQNDRKTLTPLGLTSWLKLIPQTTWPETYAELRENGVSDDVLAWLELSIGSNYINARTEAIVVASFLYVMSQKELSQKLMSQIKRTFSFKEMILRLREIFGTSSKVVVNSNVDAGTVQDITDAMAEMQALFWPDFICAAQM